MTQELLRCDILADEGECELLAALLAVRCSSGWEEQAASDGKIRFILHVPSLSPHSAPAEENFARTLREETRAVLPELDIRFTRVKDEDWQSAWRAFFTPLPLGVFLVLPPWLESQNTELLPLIIEPRSAFGTGHHASTALCLTVISKLFADGHIAADMNFLDLGAGTGILGIACCLLGLSGLALDTDPLAVENAVENKKRNACSKLEILEGGVEATDGRRFDLVVANILARPLKELAPDICSLLKDSSCLLLSGILAEQGDAVEAAYRAQGLGPAIRKQEGEWLALVWTPNA